MHGFKYKKCIILAEGNLCHCFSMYASTLQIVLTKKVGFSSPPGVQREILVLENWVKKQNTTRSLWPTYCCWSAWHCVRASELCRSSTRWGEAQEHPGPRKWTPHCPLLVWKRTVATGETPEELRREESRNETELPFFTSGHTQTDKHLHWICKICRKICEVISNFHPTFKINVQSAMTRKWLKSIKKQKKIAAPNKHSTIMWAWVNFLKLLKFNTKVVFLNLSFE